MTRNRVQSVLQTTDDDVIRALADSRRRNVLEVLEEAGEPLALADLAIELVQKESSADDPDLVQEMARDARIRLHHVHLPKLEDVGLLTYDPDEKLVILSEAPAVGAFPELSEPLTQ